MSKELDSMAAEVAEDQKAIESVSTDTRKRVINMGKKLTRMQKLQKKEQQKAKEKGEIPETWKEWCQDQKAARPLFPNDRDVVKYVLIAKYPGAYESGMSIKEGYKNAREWKKNGGNPPTKEKVTVSSRPLVSVGVAAGKCEKKMSKLNELDFHETGGEQEWTEDEIDGCFDAVTMLRQECNHLLRKLKEVREALV